ncbi:MAG: VOC family protein [Anaerolineae bacterium]|nr:VOC family protein [Anaerolineae bacterium]
MGDKLGNNVVCQIGLIVKDIEKSSRAYADLFGMDVPQWIITDTEDKAHTRYRGEPTQARAKLAFFHLGAVDLELIEPDGKPSTWQEFLDTHGEGVHHIAFQIKGMEEQIAILDKKGMPLVQTGDYTGGRYAYVDGSKQLAVILELLENV